MLLVHNRNLTARWFPSMWSGSRRPASVEASIHPQAIGWWALAALAAIVGLAVLGQALVRQSIAEGEDYPTMAALGTGALLTIAGYERAACPLGPSRSACLRALLSGPTNGGLLVGVVPGRRGQAAVNYYLASYRSITALPITPTSLVNFGEAVNFPLIFGGMLAVPGAATLVHLLVVSVSRRRREMGLLKVLGFVNGQIVATVAWQATALAFVGIVVGVPLGTVLGRQVWDAFAGNLGAVPVPVVPWWLLAAIVLGSVVVADLLAIAPALAARRSRPQQLLRAQ
jgi:hypothetical protein